MVTRTLWCPTSSTKRTSCILSVSLDLGITAGYINDLPCGVVRICIQIMFTSKGMSVGNIKKDSADCSSQGRNKTFYLFSFQILENRSSEIFSFTFYLSSFIFHS